MNEHSSLSPILAALRHSRLDRRAALRRAVGLGLGLPLLAALAAEARGETLSPPDATAKPRRYALPWRLGVDPYAWLEDPDDPAVIAYLDAENRYAEAAMAPTAALQERLYQELIGRIDQDESTVPESWHGFSYSTRTEAGKDYELICRREGNLDAPEQVVLDLNLIAGDYLALGLWLPSPDNRFLAYDLDETGEEFWAIRVREMATGREIDRLPRSTSFQWANDSQTLLYCRHEAETHRPYTLFRHRVGSDPETNHLMFEEPDPQFWLGTEKTKDQAYVLLYADALESNEIYYLPADQPEAALTRFAPRRPNVYESLEHHGEEFLVLTDEGAPNRKLEAVADADPDGPRRVLVPHREGVLIEAMDVFPGHIVLYGRQDGFSRAWVRDVPSGATAPIAFEEAVYVVAPGSNWEFQTGSVRLHYSSPVTPPSVFVVDLASGARTLRQQAAVVGGHDPSQYVCERQFATAPDGTLVPISLVRLREAPAGLPPGPRPLQMDVDGAFGLDTEPRFGHHRLSLLERGVGYAIARVRGGGELGGRWWEAGRRLQKTHSFDDLAACAEHLIAIGETAADRLASWGGSAGGLLVGVTATRRPELFRAVVADVPVVDLVGFLLRSPIGRANQLEFGDQNDPVAGRYLLAYSPYEGVRAQAYPALLVSGGLNDTRVPYWVPAKWVARLRDTATGERRLLLRTEMDAGHAGVSSFSDAVRQTAFTYAFLLTELGVAEVPPADAVPAPTTAMGVQG